MTNYYLKILFFLKKQLKVPKINFSTEYLKEQPFTQIAMHLGYWVEKEAKFFSLLKKC